MLGAAQTYKKERAKQGARALILALLPDGRIRIPLAGLGVICAARVPGRGCICVRWSCALSVANCDGNKKGGQRVCSVGLCMLQCRF